KSVPKQKQKPISIFVKQHESGVGGAASSDRAAAKARSKLAKQPREGRAKKIPENERTPCSWQRGLGGEEARTCCCCSGLSGPSSPFRRSARLLQRMPTWVKRLAVIHKKLSRPSLNAYVATMTTSNADEGAVRLAFGPVRSRDQPCASSATPARASVALRLCFADASSVELALKLDGAEVAGRQVRGQPLLFGSRKKRRTAASSKTAGEASSAREAARSSQLESPTTPATKQTNVPSVPGPTNRLLPTPFSALLDKARSKAGLARSLPMLLGD
uniref:GAE domain-containing protein n=1 Tax=Macrostomum lignano TaxID=282301 RepID=A0A1I8FF59_9PLAT